MRWLFALLLVLLAVPAWAQAERSALARVDMSASSLTAEGRDRGKPRPLDLRLTISQPVPYRVYFLDGPPRLVVDFREIDFSGSSAEALPGSRRRCGPVTVWTHRPPWVR